MKPVRPGDTLTFSTEVVEKVDLKSRPALGLVLSRNEARGPDGTLYMRFIGKGLVPRQTDTEDDMALKGKMIAG